MNAEFRKIQQDIRLKQFAPVYLIDGEETFYLDKITELFENNILQPAERDFNLTVLYGKDVTPSDVLNACRRFPMFAERQVVILKDAAQIKNGDADDKESKGLNGLLPYIEKPAPYTVFLIEYPLKKADGKTKLVKKIKEKGVYFTADKRKDDDMPSWIEEYGHTINFKIDRKEAEALATCLGNDLKKIENEISKIRISEPEATQLTHQHITKYLGVSKEYNIFDLPITLTGNDEVKLMRMIHYFSTHSKAAPMPLVIGAFYGHFARLYAYYFVKHLPDKEAGAKMGTNSYYLGSMKKIYEQWPINRIENAIITLSRYSRKAVGMSNAAGDRDLFKEMIGKLLYD